MRAQSTIFGAEYASEHPGHVEGEVVGREKGGILKILWDDDKDEGESAALRSHWKHVEKVASMAQDASAAEQHAYLLVNVLEKDILKSPEERDQGNDSD